MELNIVTAKGSAEKKTEKVQKRKRKMPAMKKQAAINDDSEEICSANTCLRPAGIYSTVCLVRCLYCSQESAINKLL